MTSFHDGYSVGRLPCTITQDVTGPNVATPFAVPRNAAGHAFVLSRGVLAPMAMAIGFVPEEQFLERQAAQDAEIEQLKQEIVSKDEEIAALRYPAQRYHAIMAAEDGADLERQIAEDTVQRQRAKINSLTGKRQENREAVSA